MNPDPAAYNNDTLLCELPDPCVDRCDGSLYEAVKGAGYAGTRQCINELNCWGWKVQEFLSFLEGAKTPEDDAA